MGENKLQPLLSRFIANRFSGIEKKNKIESTSVLRMVFVGYLYFAVSAKNDKNNNTHRNLTRERSVSYNISTLVRFPYRENSFKQRYPYEGVNVV